jgi:hypothetical protein
MSLAQIISKEGKSHAKAKNVIIFTIAIIFIKSWLFEFTRPKTTVVAGKGPVRKLSPPSA